MMRAFLSIFLLTAVSAFSQTPKVAIIGLGHSHVWGHLGRILKRDQVQLVGVAEPDAALAGEAKKSGVADNLFYTDYHKLLAEKKPDIVWAFVENNRHLEIVKACAPLGIEIIFEKPLASTYKDALAIRDLARKHNINVITNYQMAWWPANYAAKAAADSGDIGKVWRLHGIVGHGGPGSEGVRSKYFFDWLTDPEKNGAGALMDFGCYNALWSLWYLGRPTSVYATANHLRPETFPKVEDNADIVLTYPNGVGFFEGSWDLPRGFQNLEVFGRTGSVTMQESKVQLQKGRNNTDVKLDPRPADEADPIHFAVAHWKNKTPNEGLTALDINVQVIEIIEAAKESIRTGRAVKLK